MFTKQSKLTRQIDLEFMEKQSQMFKVTHIRKSLTKLAKNPTNLNLLFEKSHYPSVCLYPENSKLTDFYSQEKLNEFD